MSLSCVETEILRVLSDGLPCEFRSLSPDEAAALVTLRSKGLIECQLTAPSSAPLGLVTLYRITDAGCLALLSAQQIPGDERHHRTREPVTHKPQKRNLEAVKYWVLVVLTGLFVAVSGAYIVFLLGW